jgi:hypothetical protein
MFGKAHRVSPLQLRKQLLIAESELNRAETAGDLACLRAGVRALAGRAETFGSIASAAAALLSGLAGWRRNARRADPPKPSWIQTVLQGAGVISNVWLAFKAARRDRTD